MGWEGERGDRQEWGGRGERGIDRGSGVGEGEGDRQEWGGRGREWG